MHLHISELAVCPIGKIYAHLRVYSFDLTFLTSSFVEKNGPAVGLKVMNLLAVYVCCTFFFFFTFDLILRLAGISRLDIRLYAFNIIRMDAILYLSLPSKVFFSFK